MDIKERKAVVPGVVDRVHFEKMESCIRHIFLKKRWQGIRPGTGFYSRLHLVMALK
ncbi:MAG: hypothetical protein NTV68_15455 [Methanomicrobiales archaeon]|nr:hypothetical protein [Methanomicrobiales archaeon]